MGQYSKVPFIDKKSNQQMVQSSTPDPDESYLFEETHGDPGPPRSSAVSPLPEPEQGRGAKVNSSPRQSSVTSLRDASGPPCVKCSHLPCPLSGTPNTLLTLLLTSLTVFLATWTVLGPAAGPGGEIFALLLLIFLALLGGMLIKLLGRMLSIICRSTISLPPLLGMLLVGVLMKNVPYSFDCSTFHPQNVSDLLENLNLESPDGHLSFKRSIPDSLIRQPRSAPDSQYTVGTESPLCRSQTIGHDLNPQVNRALRTLCLTVILLRAGLELDLSALRQLSAMVLRATFIPCFLEAGAVAVLSHFILDFPWSVGFLLGFVLAAVSPAVILPCLLVLSEQGYGVEKGIPTLVISACAADDVVAISGFGVFLGIIFNEEADALQLALHGPIEVIIGLSFGVVWGMLAQWLPHKNSHNVGFFRWLILFGGGIIALFGAHLVHYDGAGGLATIIMAVVAMARWRKEGWGEHNPVSNIFTNMWVILEPVIFALIGTEIQVDLMDTGRLSLGILVLLSSLAIRMVGTFFAVACGNLNTKEKIFMSFAWVPKATVQAALGPVFLDNVIKQGKTEWEWLGSDILTLAVLSILITAPLGALCILGLGPLLLQKGGRENSRRESQGL